jgi:hypothetical protein
MTWASGLVATLSVFRWAPGGVCFWLDLAVAVHQSCLSDFLVDEQLRC